MKNYTITEEDLIVEFANLEVDVATIERSLDAALTEAVELPDEGDVFTRFKDISHMMDGAKRGLGLTNKIKDPAMRAKHKSQVMSNMNRIRAHIKRLEKEMEAHWEQWRRSSKGEDKKVDVESNDG